MSFQTIAYAGRAVVEALVTGKVSGGYNVGTVYLEMAGAEAEVKAIWAKLVSAKMRKSGYVDKVTINGSQVRMEKHTKYVTIPTRLPNGVVCLGMLHPQATVIEPGKMFYAIFQKDTGIPFDKWVARLGPALDIPIKMEWAGWLWEEALARAGNYSYNQPIVKLTSTGNAVGYKVDASLVAIWLRIIREQLGFEVCEKCEEIADELVAHQWYQGYGTRRKLMTQQICKECEDGVRRD